ncbi:MAG: 50S ribosomal protein L6 [Thermoprotei archaeon]|nr:MAG: 50S ribosomal protein L6 [Thermoprotei archaeon]
MVREYYVAHEVEIPDGVNITVDGKKVVVEGPLGKIEKDFSHLKKLSIIKEDNKIRVETYHAKKKEYAAVRTVASHIENMIIGVTKGYRYKMKIVYAHFPMSIKVEGDKIVIENYLGERGKRYAKLLPGVKVKVQKDDVIIEGIDKEAVGQTAANLHLAARLTGKRKMSPHGREGSGPGILDGIYLYKVEHMKE